MKVEGSLKVDLGKAGRLGGILTKVLLNNLLDILIFRFTDVAVFHIPVILGVLT